MLRALPPFFLQQLVWVPARLALLFFVRLKVNGLEHIHHLHAPAIFASNHVSELDPILLPAALPFFSRFAPIFYVSREKGFYQNTLLKRLLYGGFFFKCWGAYPVNVGLKDYQRSLATHINLIQKGASVLIFPEGKTNISKHPGEAKAGVVFLSSATGSPIVPIALSGVNDITWKTFFLRKHLVTLSFMEPVNPSSSFPRETPLDEHKEQARALMSSIYKEVEKNSR